MINIIRYSKMGFEPQKQTFHLEHNVEPIINDNIFNEMLSKANDYQKGLLLSVRNSQKEFMEKHYDDLKSGIWVFIDGHKCNQSLNHLKERVPCWKAQMPENTEVYDVNFTKTMRLDDLECKIFGCYIPERELKKIRNIQKTKNQHIKKDFNCENIQKIKENINETEER